MKKNKIIKWLVSLFAVGSLIAGGIAYYLFNMPHRNVQAAKSDFSFNASQIVNEYLADVTKANEKYLDEEGDSKILEVTGTVSEISEDFNSNKVLLLKSESDKAGVSCTFIPETNASIDDIRVGETVIIKGVIRSGASYDKDLGMYEHVIMEKCNIVLK